MEIKSMYDRMSMQKTIVCCVPDNFDEYKFKQLVNGIPIEHCVCNIQKFTVSELLDELLQKTNPEE